MKYNYYKRKSVVLSGLPESIVYLPIPTQSQGQGSKLGWVRETHNQLPQIDSGHVKKNNKIKYLDSHQLQAFYSRTAWTHVCHSNPPAWHREDDYQCLFYSDLYLVYY